MIKNEVDLCIHPETGFRPVRGPDGETLEVDANAPSCKHPCPYK